MATKPELQIIRICLTTIVHLAPNQDAQVKCCNPLGLEFHSFSDQNKQNSQSFTYSKPLRDANEIQVEVSVTTQTLLKPEASVELSRLTYREIYRNIQHVYIYIYTYTHTIFILCMKTDHVNVSSIV